MKTIELNCQQCGKEFERELKVHTYRALKHGLKFFCSRNCSTIYRNLHLPENVNYSDNIKKFAGNKKDEFSPFRFFISACRARKHHRCDITLEYLKELWESQYGICPYTGFKMELPETTNGYSTHNKPLKRASLYRINSNSGYIKGNVEFVCLFINFAKNGYPKSDVMAVINELKTGAA